MQSIREQIARYEALQVAPTELPDFDAFWGEAAERCATLPLNVRGGRVASPWPEVEVRDLTFEGLDGTPVHAWLLLPPEARQGRVPAVVHFHGAGGDRGRPLDFAAWLLAGCAVVSFDFRMQRGETGSQTGFSGNIKYGWWTLGITEPRSSYLYCVWTDGLRAVRLARETPEIDAKRIAVEGASQGGGLALGMAALDRSVALCLADVPSSCRMEERIFRRAGGAAGIADYLRANPDRMEAVCRTLSYFDNLNHASRITCPVLVSCGLKDAVSPPDCIYAAYNRIQAPKEMAAYPFAEHEGGGSLHAERKLTLLRRTFLDG